MRGQEGGGDSGIAAMSSGVSVLRIGRSRVEIRANDSTANSRSVPYYSNGSSDGKFDESATRALRHGAATRLGREVGWIGLDALVVAASFYIATYIRFVDSGGGAEAIWFRLPYLLIPVVALFLISNQFWSLNRRVWRYASGIEIFVIFSSVGICSLVLLVADVAITANGHERLLPIGVLVMGGFFSATGMTVVRYRWRIIPAILRWRLIAAMIRSRHLNGRTRAIIYGAGDSGQFVADRLMVRPEDHEFALVGFVDDDRRKVGQRIHGLPVLGSGEAIEMLVERYRVDVIVLAVSNATQAQRQRMLNICTRTRAQVKVAPNFFDIVASAATPLLRELRVTDMLGRPEAMVDHEACARVIGGKVVLVTGAAGSVGSELCRQIAMFSPRLLVGLDNNESGLYDLSIDLRSGLNPLALEPVVADVRNRGAINRAFQRFGPDVVFHAAAYKHVPLMERFPEEAVLVNVLGTEVMLEAARNASAERFVLVSTDKAVKPSSTMGATKRLAELLVLSNDHYGQMLTTAVRFGNVLGSRGSVVPTFAKQIQRGGPVTVTHPEMTRYFMEVSEAAILIIQAAAMTKGTDLFMLEMGEPVKIDDLARRMIRVRGLRPDVDIKILYTGTRPGEKLHEELVLDGEERVATEHPMIHRIRSSPPSNGRLELAPLCKLAEQHETSSVISALMEICNHHATTLSDGPLVAVANDPRNLVTQN